MTQSSQRKRILAAAAKLFQRQGFPATTVRMLAAEVDLGASSLYNHIAGKQELLHEICYTSAARFESGLNEMSAVAKTGHELLSSIVRLHVGLAVHHPETVTVFNDEWRHLEKEALDGFLRKRKSYEEELERLLSTAVSRGELLPVPMAVALPTFLASLSWIYQVKYLHSTDINTLSEQLTALWASGWLVQKQALTIS